MNSLEAKEVLAAYLIGRRVKADSLQRALDLINSDRLAARALSEEMRGGGEDDCEVCRQNLAEFSELSPADAAREMPFLFAHLEACGECRSAYWEIKPQWRIAIEAQVIRETINKELTAGIYLKFSRAGQFIAGKLDLRAICQPILEGVLLGPSPDEDEDGDAVETRRIEWKLRDDDAQCLIHLTADSLQSGQASLKCELISDPTSVIEANRARLDLRRAETGTLEFSGLLAQLQRQPLRLSPGAWIVKVLITGGGQSFAWEIPITLDAAAA